jgi:hypothetical protein
MEKIQITGHDWNMTVESFVMPLEGCGSHDDPAAVVDAYGRELHVIGVRRHGNRVELVIDTGEVGR